MLITSYNPDSLGDTLIAIVAQDEANQTSKQAGDVVVITGKDDKLLGVNFFNVSKILGTIDARGQVFLTPDQVAKLNAALTAAGFTQQLEADATPKFVIGVVTEFVAHPDSDHLHITQVDLGGYTKQIVCGAPNAALGQHVVAALPGAMMPDGKVIWPGALRGVDSYGMLCSARELALPNAPQERGILVLPDTVAAGTPYDFDKAAAFLAAK
ncbi:YtpR family tRNA-binding protein [Lacticaseibacillus sharpeae]|uniref:EMAP domain n=1 Tax=Lacticaseibacillus sharpeae JCM 1186 = DSM 20505 TaxID=1291052 RepID=A0A0R1ZND6_9LACO|nr:DUF4479 and tRNA-binding domain-containing protein [Lacticaseibacillus sharpeae]KRM56592.1 EMAP domain [Lacticaseibacillus sharpeae JCM 1186 = DSM 20505]